jgi:hypothetical protein
VSDEDNTRRTEPVGDDARGVGAPSVEMFTTNSIGLSVTETSCPSTANQTTTVAPSGSGQKKKCTTLGTMCKQDKPPIDQVTIELRPYRGSQSPLDLVDVEHIFGCLFEAF